MKGLVKRYKRDTEGVDGKLRDQLIMDYAPLIRFIAQRISARLPSNIELDDLISAGVIGLMDAINKYDPSRDNKFKTYAEFRVRGAILDELRSQDWVPRSVRDKAKMIERAFLDLEQELGHPPADELVAKHLDMDLEEYFSLVSRVKGVTLLSVDEIMGPHQTERKSLLDSIENESSENAFEMLKDKGFKSLIIENIDELPEKQKTRLILILLRRT